MSRRGFLQTGALCLVGLLSPLAGCGGQTPKRGGGRKTAVREPQALGASGAEGEKVKVRVDGGAASGVLDAAQGATAAVVMVGGMAGGIEGPSGIYPKLAERFRYNGITVLRLDYREPGDLSSCTDDPLSAVGALGRGGAKKVVLVGWSFGGCLDTRGRGERARRGVATVASATQGTEDIGKLSPEKSLLLIHGTRNTSVVPSLARYLYRKAGEPKEPVFYEGDGHDIEIHIEVMLRKIYTWSTKLLASSASGDPRQARRVLRPGHGQQDAICHEGRA